MATLQFSAHPFKPILGFHRPVNGVETPLNSFLYLRPVRNAPPNHFTSRSKNNVRLLLSKSVHRVFASNGSSEGSEVTKSSEAAKGPPSLTILAGFLVFFAVCWVIGSVVMWLFGLIFRLPPSK